MIRSDRVEIARAELWSFARRLRRRAEPGSAESARRQRARADGVVLPHARVAADARAARTARPASTTRWRSRASTGIGAWILGRNMFGPVRGPWPDESWKGWWGDEPPYHTPVFVLTHHPRAAAARWRAAPSSASSPTASTRRSSRRGRPPAARDVRLGGGVVDGSAVPAARLIDELHLAVRPVLLGAGEPLLNGIDLRCARLRVREVGRGRTRDARPGEAPRLIPSRRTPRRSGNLAR